MCQLFGSLLLFLCYPVLTGQVSLDLPPSDAGICFEDINLICNTSGAIDSSRTWTRPPSAVPVMSDGTEVATVNKYSESIDTSFFTLRIKNFMQTDEGQYRCINGFDESPIELLKYECVQETNVTVLRDDQTKKPQVSMVYIYPNTATVQSVHFISVGGTNKFIQGSQGTQDVQPNGDHFDLTWNSTVELPDGTYTCNITVQLISVQIISKSDLLFGKPEPLPGPCEIILCYILLILSCVLILPVFIGTHVYFIHKRHTCAVKELTIKDYGIKGCLVGFCICLLKIMIQLITYFLPFKECAVVTCLVIPIIVMPVVSGAGVAIVGGIVHLKKNPDKNEESAGNKGTKLQKKNTGSSDDTNSKL